MSDPVFQQGPSSGVPYLLKRTAADRVELPSVLMLHGWSGDERVMWVLEGVLPETRLIASLRGLYPIPGSGYRWIEGAASLDSSMQDFRPGADAILSVIRELNHHEGLDPARTILIGFSQGAGIAFALAALGLLRPLAIISLAGFLPQGDLHRLSGVPVFWGHGVRDDLVPIDLARRDIERLRAAGCAVTFCETDVGHRLGIECTRGLKGWLKEIGQDENGG